METLTAKWKRNQQTVTAELRALAVKHSSSPGSRLSLIADDPKRYPGQGIRSKIDAYPQTSIKDMCELAKIAEPNFDGMLAATREAHQTSILKFLIQYLRLGNSFSMITLHEEDPTDIAFAGAVVRARMAELKHDAGFGLVMSKMMAHLGLVVTDGMEPYPTVDALQLMGDVYLSFPRTRTVRSSNLGGDVVSLYNKKMRHEFRHAMNRGNYVGCVAVTGTRGYTEDDQPEVRVIPGVTETTAKMVSGMLLPVICRVQQKEPFFHLLDPIAIGAKDPKAELDACLADMCAVTTERANDGVRVAYLASDGLTD